MEREVALLIGLQACGKTTFYRRHLATTHAHVSKDLMPRSARRKEARLLRELDAHLAAGRSVAVDNTQPSEAERAGVVRVAREHGARVVGHWWAPDPALSLGRNARRAEPVPEVGVRAALARWEEPTPAEGFDALVRHDAHELDSPADDDAHHDDAHHADARDVHDREVGARDQPDEPIRSCPSV